MDRYDIFIEILNLMDETFGAKIKDAQMKNCIGDISIDGVMNDGRKLRITANITEADNG